MCNRYCTQIQLLRANQHDSCPEKFYKIHSETPTMHSFLLKMKTMDLQLKKGFIAGALM